MNAIQAIKALLNNYRAVRRGGAFIFLGKCPEGAAEWLAEACSIPTLKELNLPPLGTPGRAAPLVTRTLVFLGEGSDAIPGVPADGFGNHFRAYDKDTGKVVWTFELPEGSGTTGGPMSYMLNGKQYVLVPIGGRNHAPEIIALGLP